MTHIESPPRMVCMAGAPLATLAEAAVCVGLGYLIVKALAMCMIGICGVTLFLIWSRVARPRRKID